MGRGPLDFPSCASRAIVLAVARPAGQNQRRHHLPHPATSHETARTLARGDCPGCGRHDGDHGLARRAGGRTAGKTRPASPGAGAGGQAGVAERVHQLRLADQHHLDRLAGLAFQVAQQAQLLQQVGAEVVGLVDHQQRPLAVGVAAQQVVDEGQAHLLFGPALVRQRQVEQDRWSRPARSREVRVGEATTLATCRRRGVRAGSGTARLAHARPGRSGRPASPSPSVQRQQQRARACSWPVAG